MIQETYCSFEVSKLLKEKGFNESIRCWYDNLQDFHEEGVRMRNTDCIPPTIMCPTHQMAMAWLREMFHIHIRLIHSADESYKFEIYPMSGKYRCKCFEDYTYYSSYKETVEAALKYTLEKLI